MNIMFLWRAPFKDGGGVGSATSALAGELVKMGHQVLYLAMAEGKSYIDENGIQQLFAAKHEKSPLRVKINTVINVIKTQKIDLVINQSGIFDISVIEAIAALKSKPLVFSVHHNCVKCYQDVYSKIIRESSNFIFRFLSRFEVSGMFLKQLNKLRYGRKFKRCLSYSDKLILLSNTFVGELSVYLNSIPFDKVSVMPNPVKRNFYEEKIPFPEKENRILFVGRLNDAQKQASLLIDIWKVLYKDFPEWELDVVGDGPIYHKLLEQSKALQLKRIQFHGHQDPLPFYQKGKIFLMPSLFEGFGLVLVEAQAQGVVPVAFHCFSSIQDIVVHDETGYLIPLNDISAFISVVKHLMSSNQEKLLNTSDLAHAHARQFHPSHIAQLWLNLVDEVLSKSAKA